MIISLDRNALASLIESDPAFNLQLKDAVLSEIARRYFEKDSKKVIAAADPELFSKALAALQGDKDMMDLVTASLTTKLVTRDKEYWAKNRLTDEAKKLIDDKARLALDQAIAGASTHFQAMIQKAVDDRMAEFNVEDRIEKRVSRLTEEYIDRRANELFKARIAKLQEGI
jgi:hypothetical protein